MERWIALSLLLILLLIRIEYHRRAVERARAEQRVARVASKRSRGAAA